MRQDWGISSLAFLCFALPTQAAGPASGDTTSNTFGTRTRYEQIGLYGERSIRGFVLEDAGNYRMDGLYFSRVLTPGFVVVSGSQTHVGINALETPFPAASGLIEYQLKPVSGADQHLTEVGWRSDQGPYLYQDSQWGGEAPFGIALGLSTGPKQTYSDGSRGKYVSLGAVARWLFDSGARLRLFAQYLEREEQGALGFSARPGERMPAWPRKPSYPGAEWSKSLLQGENAGALLEGLSVQDWELSAGFFRSARQQDFDDFHLFHDIDHNGHARLSSFIGGPHETTSTSAELRVEREWPGDDVNQHWTLALRGRETESALAEGLTLNAVRQPIWQAASTQTLPQRPDNMADHHDQIRQQMFALGYRFELPQRLIASVGLQRNHHEKESRDTNRPPSVLNSRRNLHDVSLQLPLTAAMTVFAAQVRSLEESGLPPAHASNANQLLAPILARQQEWGMRWQLAPAWALIANHFDLRKPLAGMNAQGAWGLLGEARHRGIEVSLNGAIDEEWTGSVGALVFSPELRDGHSAGRSREPVGQSKRIAVASLRYRPAVWPTLSFSLNGRYNGSRWIDADNQYRTPSSSQWDLGARYTLNEGDKPWYLHLRVLNLSGKQTWSATGGELQTLSEPRAIDLRLEIPFQL